MTAERKNGNRTSANCFYTVNELLHELDALKFAVASIVEQFPPGSYQLENGRNAKRGIEYRLDYLHDCVRTLIATPPRTDK